MATLGRWTGGAKAQGNPPETWTAPTSMFDTEARNDGSAYTWTASTSTLTLPSSGLADGYLIIAYYQYHDTSNGRLNPQGQIVQASGTGNFVGGPSAGYNRDNSEDRSYVRAWAFVDNPSASATFQFQWKADVDDSTGGTEESCIEVIPFYYADIGMYTSTDHTTMGGTTPNVVPGWATTLEGTNITRSSNVITVAGDNKRYLVLGSQFFEGRGGRTQRWHGLDIDGAEEHAAKAYSYYRNTSNDESGEIFTWLLETATADITIEQTCYRGAGVAAGQGGADVDGSDPSVGDHTLVVIELNDTAEVFRSENITESGDLNLTGPIDLDLCEASGIAFNDSASFTRATDTGMNATVAMDGLFGANISAAQEVVSTTSRWTAYCRFTVYGVEDNNTRAGDYCRNNQGTQDTFGWSANLLSYVALAQDEDIGVSLQELAGGEDGGELHVQVGWGGFWGINLDTLEDSGGAIEGDLAATDVSDSASFAGDVTVQGDIAATDTSDTAVWGGDVVVQGDLADTEANPDAAALSGDVVVQGDLADTEASVDTATFAAQLVVQGDLAATEATADTAVFGGDIDVQGDVLATESTQDSSALVGSVDVQGDWAATEVTSDTAAILGEGIVGGEIHVEILKRGVG